MRITLNLSEQPASEDPASRSEARHLIDMLRETADHFFVPAAADLARKVAYQIEAQIPIPKPNEPQGLGAVVEDAEGRKWVHSPESSDDTMPWLSVEQGWQVWSDIDAVRVLSEGVVTP